MPTLLSIETSSEIASAALLIGERVLQRTTVGVLNHSQSILPMVQSLLHEAGLVLADCDAIAFGSGPGSFTGVRTACGVVQGLAFGAGLPVIPVVTLQALAQAERERSGAVNVLTALDARMGEVYWAQYRYDEQLAAWQTVTGPTLGKPGTVCARMAEGLVLAGNGFSACAGLFTLTPQLLASARDAVPQAAAVARIAATELAAGRTLSALDAQPLYLRNKIALTSAERRQLAGA